MIFAEEGDCSGTRLCDYGTKSLGRKGSGRRDVTAQGRAKSIRLRRISVSFSLSRTVSRNCQMRSYVVTFGEPVRL
jgi:hypothetical protein